MRSIKQPTLLKTLVLLKNKMDFYHRFSAIMEDVTTVFAILNRFEWMLEEEDASRIQLRLSKVAA